MPAELYRDDHHACYMFSDLIDEGEDAVQAWQGKGAHLAQLLDFARLRPLASADLQARLI